VAFAVRPIESAREIIWRTAKAVFLVVCVVPSKHRCSHSHMVYHVINLPVAFMKKSWETSP
jgi:hypothetical protein